MISFTFTMWFFSCTLEGTATLIQSLYQHYLWQLICRIHAAFWTPDYHVLAACSIVADKLPGSVANMICEHCLQTVLLSCDSTYVWRVRSCGRIQLPLVHNSDSMWAGRFAWGILRFRDSHCVVCAFNNNCRPNIWMPTRLQGSWSNWSLAQFGSISWVGWRLCGFQLRIVSWRKAKSETVINIV